MLTSQLVVTWPMILALLVAGQGGLALQGHGQARVPDHERAVGDPGLELLPGAFEEGEGVVVGGRAAYRYRLLPLVAPARSIRYWAWAAPTATLSKVT